ncbi:Hypothetical predicted protein [Olea europaea subsp. europaea]|uniref:MULE transposase domain-containing protein n=1 Tax=Olea europaea subsp. europaea TaxID=158383 RepID=A0A8S0PAB7_OLEEU|nr:Hypothetical predicted protein [Olea europaea subsp. europaea]
MIWASIVGRIGSLQVKSYTPNHTCIRDQYNKHCNYVFPTNRDIEQFKADSKWKTKSILAIVKDDLKTDITRNVAWKMRRYAKELLHGKIDEQFGKLWCYVAKVLRTNPGSTVIIANHNQVFQGIYMCFEVCNKGFVNGCRKVIGVDGCHLRGCFSEIMLTVVGHDANGCIYPIAYAIFQKENTLAWRWFMTHLESDVHIGNGSGWTIMTDRQKGLQNVVNELFLVAEHRICVRHMYSNFFSAGFKGKTLKDYLWRAAKSTTNISDYTH